VSALKICPQCGTEYELDQRFCPKDGSTLKSQGGATADLVGQIIADRYHVLKKLGEGGMGTVYLAEHVKMGRKSAVKVMNPGTVHDADAISRFNREAANASRINHPNVASVYDFGETSDGLIYLAMEFIEGPALTKVIEDAGALPPVRAADITRQAADALAVAHDMGIVHRDLKPDNIMIAKNRDGSDCVKVVDFGIAKAANNDAQKVTKTGLVVGTPEYMSPEQLAGDKLDGRSDTYSLALVAFAMMTGKLPFPADTVQESMILRLTDQPKRLLEMKSDVAWPADVQAVMDKALAREAAERYQTASEFGKALYSAVAAMPESKMTNAFTSVMGRMSTPKRPAPVIPGSGPGRMSAGATKPMPATRVNQATPAEPPAPVRAEKSKVPMFGGIAAGIAVLAVGGYFAMNAGKKDASASNGNVAAPVQSSAPAVPPVAAPLDIDVALDSIAKLTDLRTGTAAQAIDALRLLDSLPAPSKLTVEQRVLAALLRAEANVNRDSSCRAYRAVQDVEGASRGTKYESRVQFVLKNATC
jgi:eukaryotic-like serine/threonine-protein kinase